MKGKPDSICRWHPTPGPSARHAGRSATSSVPKPQPGRAFCQAGNSSAAWAAAQITTCNDLQLSLITSFEHHQPFLLR
jgi:hypothetical protein